jgi:hypothetical protein
MQKTYDISRGIKEFRKTHLNDRFFVAKISGYHSDEYKTWLSSVCCNVTPRRIALMMEAVNVGQFLPDYRAQKPEDSHVCLFVVLPQTAVYFIILHLTLFRLSGYGLDERAKLRKVQRILHRRRLTN